MENRKFFIHFMFLPTKLNRLLIANFLLKFQIKDDPYDTYKNMEF